MVSKILIITNNFNNTSRRNRTAAVGTLSPIWMEGKEKESIFYCHIVCNVTKYTEPQKKAK